MKVKKLMLVTLVLLAILTIGAVSASDDVSSDNLTVSEDVDEVSVDAFVDDEKISENSEKEVVAVSDDELVSNRGGIDALKSSERDIISNSTDINFNVISLSASDIYEGENATVIYHGPDGEVQITVSNQTFSLIANGGVGTLELYDLPVGYYSVTCGSASTAFNVLPRENEGEENSFELWLDDDPQGFDVSSPDLSGYFIAALTVPENMNGNISIVAEDDIFLFNKALNDFNPNHIRDDHIYDISLSDNGRYIFEDIDDGTVFRFAFLDEEGNEIWNGANYKLVINENIIRFELDAHNPGDYVSIDVSGDELSANDDNDFVWINLPSDVTDGKVIVTSGDYTLFEESVNFEEGTHWWSESDGHYVCSFSPNSLTNWNNLSDEDIVVFAFLDEDGNEVASKEYKIFLGENTIRFEELNSEDDELYIGIWDENDERGILYTDAEGNVISIDAPRDYEGAIFHIYVNDDEVVSWEVEFDDENDRTYNDWDLEALGISQAGEYTIAVEFGNGEYSEILLNKTISVSEFNEDVFRAMIQFTTETMRLYVPQNAEGTVTIITEKETDDDLEQIHEEIYEITSQDYGEWKVWALSDLGFEADGAFRIFTLTVTNADSEVYRYRIGHVDGEEQEDGEEEFLEDIIFEFNTQDEDGYIFEKVSYVDVGRVFIPQKDEFDGIEVTLHIILNGQEYETLNVRDLYGFYSSSRHALGFEVPLDMTKFKDKDMLTFRLEAKFGNGESAITEDNEYNDIILEDNGTYFIGHDDIDLKRLEFDAFYGNLTTGTTNNPELMGPKFDGRFVIITISNALNITEGTVTVNDGTTDIFSKSLSECDKEYDYGSVGYTYFIGLDEIMDMLPEGKDILVSFTYGVNSLIQKRIRFDDYLYKVILKEDIEKQFHFEVSDDLILHESDTAIHLWSDSDRQSIYIDLGGGYFIIYVNGKKVENLGNVSFNTWKDNFDWKEEDDDYKDRFAPDEEAFLSYVRSYWGRELELFRLTGHAQGASELDITLADLGINESGTYNIRIVHYPSVPGGLDDHSNIGEYIDGVYAEEYFSPDYTEVFNGNITCNLNPDYAGVVILNESRYQHGVPFLFTFKFGDNVLSESNRILIYINDELAFNCTTLFYAEDDDGEMELCDLWKVTPGEFNKELLNEYGFLDVGDYNAVVYLVKGSDEPVEIGSGTFTVVKQKGDMNFTMGSTTEDDGIHTIIYADIPEGDWDGYSLEIIIGDSEKIVPDVDDVDDWFPRWYNEYAIFKDNQIYSKESLEDIIGKGPVAIDLGVLDEGTHIWVEFGHGEETVYGDWDFYQNDFTVKAASVPADSDLKVTVENINFGETAVVNIEMDEAINGEVLVSAGGFNYTVTVTNGKASQNISGLKAGTYDVAVKFEGNDDYNPVENTTSFKVTKLTPVIEITAGEAIEGSDLNITVTIANATGIVDINGNIITLMDGKATTTIKTLISGNLTVEVNYAGDDKYLKASKTTNIVVKAKENPNLNISALDIIFGETATINIEINANVTGKVTVDGEEISITNGKGTYSMSNLNAGNYSLTIAFEGDKYFNADEKTAEFKVNRADSSISASDISFEYGASGSSSITLDGASDYNAIVKDHPEAEITKEGNMVTVKNLTVGTYTLEVTTVSDENHNPATATATITVTKIASTVTYSNAVVFDFGKTGTTNITFTGATGFYATINGENDTVNINGSTVSISKLNAGNYTLIVTTIPDEDHAPVSVSVPVTVNALKTKIKATTQITTFGSSRNIIIRLTDANNVALSDQKITVVINRVSKTLTTNANGQVIFAIPTNLVPKTHAIKITFAGSANYIKSTGTSKVLVKKATPKIYAAKRTFNSKIKVKPYSIILKTDKNKAMKKVKVFIKVNGRTYSAFTNSLGKATFKITQLTKKANYIAVISYLGNGYFNKVTKKVIITNR